MTKGSRCAPLLRWLLAGYVAWALFIVALIAVDIEVIDLFKDAPQLSEHLVHDNLAEVVLGKDASEPIVSSILSVLILAWLVRFRRQILATSYVILALALVGLGVPFLIDLRHVIDFNPKWWGAVEESMELAGIVTLLVYAAIESWDALVPVSRAPTPAEP